MYPSLHLNSKFQILKIEPFKTFYTQSESIVCIIKPQLLALFPVTHASSSLFQTTFCKGCFIQKKE